MLDRFFHLADNQTSVRREFLAGLTTFLTMAYILFLQPAILSKDFAGNSTGLDPDAVLLATCVASALATLIMGLYAKYPIALAPGMGENFVFVAVITTLAANHVPNAWQVALAIVLVAGVLFLVLSLAGVREAILDALSPSMRNGIAVGIGMFIAFIGLKNAGVIVESPGTLVQLNENMLSADLAVFWFGFLVTVALYVWKVRGSILLGILAAFLLAIGLKAAGVPAAIQWPTQVMGFPDIEQNAAFQMDLWSIVTYWKLCIPFIFVFLFMDLFDTLGTLIGVSEQAGFMEDGRLPRARQAMTADAVGTVAGACLGTSTVTSYIESAAGVEQGGRTGLTSVTVAALFLVALLFSPLLNVVGAYAPVTAPALVMVGCMMARNVTKIQWNDPSESVPAFLIVIGIPLCFSIADGMAIGLIAYPIVKLLGGKAREVKWLMYLLALILLAYFVLVRADAVSRLLSLRC